MHIIIPVWGWRAESLFCEKRAGETRGAFLLVSPCSTTIYAFRTARLARKLSCVPGFRDAQRVEVRESMCARLLHPPRAGPRSRMKLTKVVIRVHHECIRGHVLMYSAMCDLLSDLDQEGVKTNYHLVVLFC
jgi:hypothetical protein